MGQRKKKYTKKLIIGCHFILPIHKQHNNLNHTMIIEENINSDYKIISKHHFEIIFLQQNPQGTFNPAINVHKMLLTYCKNQANLIMPDGPYFMLR